MPSIAARVHRVEPGPADAVAVWLGDWQVRRDAGLIERRGAQVRLEPRQMDVLWTLCLSAPDTVSAEQLLDTVWQGGFHGDNPVHKAVALLRRALGDSAAAPRYIQTVRKRGYRVIASVRPVGEEPASPMRVRAEWAGGNPFRGLSAFDERHAAVFFGRDAAVRRLTTAAQRQLEGGCGFVLLLGASGSGKTSLLHAGWQPAIVSEHGIEGLRAHAAARLDGSSAGPNLMRSLAGCLMDWSVHGRPVFLPGEVERLADDLTRAPAAVAARVQAALSRPPPHPSAPATLLLIVDQTEALLPQTVQADDGLSCFAEALGCLLREAGVLAVMACRDDAYPRLLQRLPGVIDLKGEHGHVDLPPMTAGELALCIRGPAAKAGLRFELDPHSRVRLDDRLRDEAVRHPHSLPLLQHALDLLYEGRTEAGFLTFETYARIGGLAGAIAQQAETTFAALDASTRAALPEVLRQLVRLDGTDLDLVARKVELDAFATPAAKRLVEAFIAARQFTCEAECGRFRIGVAHEAVLRHWPRVRHWVDENRQHLRAQARLVEAARRWRRDDRRDDLLLSSERQVEEARELLRSPEVRWAPDELAFLRRSLASHRRRRAWRTTAVAAFAAVSLAAALMGVRAMHAAGEAEARTREAQALVDYLLGDLAGRLRPLGRLDLLSSAAERALQSLQSGGGGSASSEGDRLRAQALLTLGEVLAGQGETARASQAFAEAERLNHAVLERQDDLATRRQAGQIAFWQGALAHQDGRREQARRHWEGYAAHAQAMRRLQPDAPVAWLEQSYALNNLGTLAREQGESHRAIALFRASLALKQRYVAAHPEDANAAGELADTVSWLASTMEDLGQLQGAAGLMREERTVLERLVRSDPRHAPLRHRLALSQLRGALLERHFADGAVRAMPLLEAATRELDALGRLDPSNRDWQRDRAFARLHRGQAHERVQDEHGARRDYREALRILAALQAGSDATVPDWLRIRAKAQLRLAVLSAAAEERRALRGADEARAQLERLLRDGPEDPDSVHALATAHATLGQLHRLAGRHDEAARQWQAAAALLSSRARPDDHRALDLLANVLHHAGREDEAANLRRRLTRMGYDT